MSEKTHQPTDHKLREARKKGQIPRSKLFTSAAVTLGGLAGTLAFSSETAVRLRGWATALLSLRPTAPADALVEGLRVLASCAAPTLGGALVGSLCASVATSGLQLNVSHVSPQLDRIDPFQGAKKLFSARQLIDVLKGLLVAGVVAAILWSGVRDAGPDVFRAIAYSGPTAMAVTLRVLGPLVVKASVVLLVLGVADWALARHRHVKDLMMSHEEVKQEHKNSEGDPHHKSQRKALHKQIAAGGPARGVQKATAVVVNPTHIAVALRYDESECDAPYIVAKGREEDALKIRKDAQSLGIPVVRDIPLARSLVHYDMGEEVPEELYKAAAAVLKVAMESTAKNEGPEGKTP